MWLPCAIRGAAILGLAARQAATLMAFLLLLGLSGFIAEAVTPGPATGLEVRVTETGRLSLSTDGAGSNDAAGGAIQVDKPNAAATVRSAFFTCASNFRRIINDGEVALDGNPITWSDSVLNNAGESANFFNNVFADVTPVVKPKVDAAIPGLVGFTQTEVDTTTIDGCGLYVIFDDPAQVTDNTIFILFGGQSTDGDDFAVTLAEPLRTGDIARMGLAISFSFQGQPAGSHLCGDAAPMFSTLDVNGTRVSSCAGSADDGRGTAANGLLITVGGIGDDPANPADPFQQAADGRQPRVNEDELYDLTPFLGPTDTRILVQTLNPSDDDNIFAGHIFVTRPAIVGEGITLAPLSASNPVGTQHTVTATVVDDLGNPVTGRLVDFHIVSGPNAGLTGNDTTDAQGEAVFTYTGLGGPGTDNLEARFVDSRGNTQVSNPVTKTWTVADLRFADETNSLTVNTTAGEFTLTYSVDGVQSLCSGGSARVDESLLTISSRCREDFRDVVRAIGLTNMGVVVQLIDRVGDNGGDLLIRRFMLRPQ
jgi:hypothetical protein